MCLHRPRMWRVHLLLLRHQRTGTGSASSSWSRTWRVFCLKSVNWADQTTNRPRPDPRRPAKSQCQNSVTLADRRTLTAIRSNSAASVEFADCTFSVLLFAITKLESQRGPISIITINYFSTPATNLMHSATVWWLSRQIPSISATKQINYILTVRFFCVFFFFLYFLSFFFLCAFYTTYVIHCQINYR